MAPEAANGLIHEAEPKTLNSSLISQYLMNCNKSTLESVLIMTD